MNKQWIITWLMVLMIAFGFNEPVRAENQPENRYPNQSRIGLTEQEQAWIAEHNIIRTQAYDGFPPNGFLDKNGNFVGITADYLSLISQRTGIRFEYIPAKVDELDQKVKSGEIDVIYSYDIPERKTYLNFTQPFTTRT